MCQITIISIIILILLVLLFVRGCRDEGFYIEPNMVAGGYQAGPKDFELEGPGNAAWSGY